MIKIIVVYIKLLFVLFQIKNGNKDLNKFIFIIYFVFKGVFDFFGFNYYMINFVWEEICDINWYSYESDQDIDIFEDLCWNM